MRVGLALGATILLWPSFPSLERRAIDVSAILVLLAAGTWSIYFIGPKMLLARFGACDFCSTRSPQCRLPRSLLPQSHPS